MKAPSSYVAIVAGSTGAVGRDLVAELVASAKCAKVIALARRDIPQDQWAKAFPLLDESAAVSKLEVRKVNYDSLSDQDVRESDKIDAAFNCLSTTRKDAGSPEAFRKVDFEYAARFAELAKAANASYFGHLTSSHANKNSWFLFPQTKGEVDEAVLLLGFARTSMFRPGLLNRRDFSRTMESIAMRIFPSIATQAVAKGMVSDFETGTADREWNNTELKTFE